MATTHEAVGTRFGNGRGAPRARTIVVGAALAATLFSSFAVGRLSAPQGGAPALRPVTTEVLDQLVAPHEPSLPHDHPRVKVG
jgi:hypothetical protein